MSGRRRSRRRNSRSASPSEGSSPTSSQRKVATVVSVALANVDLSDQDSVERHARGIGSTAIT
ncbi:unnamed protein product [Haemonchus placei]|uniref:Capsid protein n=1 Tax=Haemonchus placei TaxID=6290 RepID=A0A0N4WMQ1_HAEPC|nr:unnamed protein product [Haemonchus placei]